MKEVIEMNKGDTLTLEDRITILNDDQRCIFNQIKNHLFRNMKIMNASVSLNHYECLSVV